MLLIGNILKPLAKSVLIPLGLRAATSTTDAAICKKMFGPGATALIISIEEIMEINKSPKESGLVIKGVNQTIKNETKEQKGGFLRMLFGTLFATLSGYFLTGKGTVRAVQDFSCHLIS